MMPAPKHYSFKGEMLTLSEIARRTDLTAAALYNRVVNMCMKPEDAAATPPMTPGVKPALYDFHGEMLTVREIATRTGLSLSTARKCVAGDGVFRPMPKPTTRRPSGRRYTFAGKSLTLTEWSELTGIRRGTLETRLNECRWPLAKALTTPALNNKQRGQRRRNQRIIREMIATINASIHADRRTTNSATASATTTTTTGGHSQTSPEHAGTGAGRHAHHLQAGMKSYDRHS